ncbi:glycosyltransferase [Hymenobacter ginsengisoli]|uniref:Glycosyltransferase n=1 Tax=Hymenobacter ginsengisoli TaxID=1051626 RepID=A0ABP8QND7_9BACT|nr:glycosyltransferase family 2 protein [Hymenobacter sp. KCTC 23674]MBO2032751.1 glycosyltransferase [Hymenobacter sp. BT559]
MVKLSVVIVSYNVCYFLEQTLLSVRQAAAELGEPVEVFVVDNNSTDTSAAMVQQRFPEVILLQNNDNRGFSRANNQALRLATGQYQLLLNPDTLVAEDTFRRCCDFLDAHPRCGGLGVMMLDGQGRFLPESKRGLPTPVVAFYKIFGLARLFPGSRTFGRYHLGFLDKHEPHEVAVLSGAFMLLRQAALAQVGLLDEDYFMYGEDIDLSYRLTQGGWQNWYFPGTRILHYKGESTKRTSVNYVLVFYRAMVIFARKHFASSQAGAVSLLINSAIWLRAGLALAQRLATAATPMLLDAGLLYAGIYLLKSYWEATLKSVRAPFPPQYMLVAVPLYIATWLTTTWLSGGYDHPMRARRVLRGVAVGTVLISAVSNFFDNWRFSKALIVLGGGWAVAALLGRRLLSHWLRHGNLRLSQGQPKTLAIVGSAAESRRVRQLLAQARVPSKIIGYIRPGGSLAPPIPPQPDYLGTVAELPALLRLYGLTELIFCGQDLPASQIIDLMASLPARPPVAYKILPAGSQYIIGSSHKDAPGDYYTLNSSWRLSQPAQRRNKRLLDLVACLLVALGSPLLLPAQRRPRGLLPHLLQVLRGRRSWVGLRYLPEATRQAAVLSPADAAPTDAPLTEAARQRLERLYAQDYELAFDLGVLWRGWRRLGG